MDEATSGLGFIVHIHILITSLKLVQHLVQALKLGFHPFSLPDPADVFILLVGTAIMVAFHQLAFIQCFADEFRNVIVGFG